MDTKNEKKVKVTLNGPYEITGSIPLNKLRYVGNSKGATLRYEEVEKYPLQETYYLCRCGKTKSRPFCDGSHYEGFEGRTTAGHKTYDEMAEATSGRFIDLLDAEELCAVARFCDTKGSTWNLVERGSLPEMADVVIQQCNDCPSGRLTAVTKDGKRIEPDLPQEISILEDEPRKVHGPIWVKGGIPIEDESGRIYPVRNRVTLCQCGKSHNKPFCDARHMDNEGEME